MTRKEYLACMLFIASITASFFFGYFIFRFELIESARPDIKVVPEINPKVCTVDIDAVHGGIISGKIGEKKVRLRYLGGIIPVDSDGKFRFEFE